MLSKVPMLAERQAVAAAIEKFNDIGDREYAATKENLARQEAIRDALNERHRREMDEALAPLQDEYNQLCEPFRKEMDALEGYPDIDDGWQMHDDHCGVYCCEISGLPLHDDDDLVEHGDGHALAVLANAGVTISNDPSNSTKP